MGIAFVHRVGAPTCLVVALLAAMQFRLDIVIAVWTGLPGKPLWLGLGVLTWVAAAFTLTRILDVLVWSRVGGGVPGRKAPRLLVQMTNLLIYFAMVIVVMTNVFSASVTGIVATSSVMGLVIGFAVKSLISDTFSGIALNLDRGFVIGDFISILGRPGTVRLMGRVTEINWRSTYMVTPENSMLVIPNTLMSESIVLNMSKPEVAGEFEMIVALDFEVPTERALRVLTAVMESAAAENPAIFDVKARVSEVNTTGVNYKIKYMLDPSKFAPGKAKHLILRLLVRHLTMTGLTVAHPKLDNWTRTDLGFDEELGDVNNRQRLLRQVALFKGLDDADLADLAARMTERHYAPGARIIVAADPGQSMFVMSEGLVSVQVRAQDVDVDVASLAPGDFFGEMSLLTGEPRSASVIAVTEAVAFEIDKYHLEPLLNSNPAASELLSMAAAERRVASEAARTAMPPEQLAAEQRSLAGRILAGMGKFFGRRSKPALVTERK